MLSRALELAQLVSCMQRQIQNGRRTSERKRLMSERLATRVAMCANSAGSTCAPAWPLGAPRSCHYKYRACATLGRDAPAGCLRGQGWGAALGAARPSHLATFERAPNTARFTSDQVVVHLQALLFTQLESHLNLINDHQESTKQDELA